MIRANLAANYVGAILVTILQLVAAPIYISTIGLDAYGVFGIQATLLLFASLIDMGLTPSLTRDLARSSTELRENGKAHATLRAYERVATTIYFCSVLILIAVLPYILSKWIQNSSFPADRLVWYFQLMVFQVGLQLGINFYSGGLLGLQQHVKYNIINIVFSLIRFSAAVLGAILYSDLSAVLLAGLPFSLCQLVVTRYMILRAVSGDTAPASFSHSQVNLRYSFGVACIVLFSLILTQSDKLIVGRYLSLSDLGLYTLAGTFASVVGKPVAPLLATLSPRMTQLIEMGNTKELVRLYHGSSQIAAILVFPMTLALLVFSPDLSSFLPIKESQRAIFVEVFCLLLAGHALNSLVILPYGLSLSYGWTSYGIWQNSLACIFYLPGLYLLLQSRGLEGVATAWFLLNALFFIVSVPFLHSKLLIAELRPWYLRDNFPSFCISILMSTLVFFLVPSAIPGPFRWLAPLFAFGLAFGGSVLISSHTRLYVKNIWRTVVRRNW